MHPDPVELDIPRPDGTLRVLRWGRGPRQAVALHGITANAVSWLPVADALPTEWPCSPWTCAAAGTARSCPARTGSTGTSPTSWTPSLTWAWSYRC